MWYDHNTWLLYMIFMNATQQLLLYRHDHFFYSISQTFDVDLTFPVHVTHASFTILLENVCI